MLTHIFSAMKNSIDRYFSIRKLGSNIRTEIIAGISTFLAGMYIILVNPAILADAGIPYSAALTATEVLCAFMTITMGIYAKSPILVAPGMGINAYFTYTIVIGMKVDPHIALGAIFWSGVVFILLSVFNIRNLIIKAIPKVIRSAGAVGIGLFITLIGFHNAGFIVVKEPFIGVGQFNISTLLFLIGLFLTIILIVRKVKAALIISIVITTLIAWPVGRWFGDFASTETVTKPLIEIGNIFASPDFSWFFKLNLVDSLSYSFIPIVFSLLFVDMFDSITTFVGLSEASGLVDENGDPKNMKKAMITDGFATFFSSLFGTSSGTAYVESAVGIEQGGRSGLTAVVTGLLFVPFLFIAPIAAAVPALATAPALVMVGFFMSSALKNINWKDAENAIPAFLTIILIPLTYSLTQGLVFGLLSYSFIKIFVGKSRAIPLILWIINGFSILLLCIEYKIL